MSDINGSITKDAAIALAARQLDEIKKQAAWRQAIGAVSLVAAAGTALWLGPTIAIVVAVLLIAAVWLLPASAKRIFGDSIALRDRSGAIRLAAVVDGNGLPQIFMRDTKGRQRLVIGMNEQGFPCAIMFGEEQDPRLAIALSPEGPAVAEMSEDGSLSAQLVTSNTSGQGSLELHAQGKAQTTTIWPAVVDMKHGESWLGIDTLSDAVSVAAKCEGAEATWTVKSDTTGIRLTNGASTAGLLNSADGGAVFGIMGGGKPNVIPLNASESGSVPVGGDDLSRRGRSDASS